MIDLPELPDIARYRFRLRDDDARGRFVLPAYLAHRTIVSFYLRQEPSERVSNECGHALRVDGCNDDELAFVLGGLADWQHEGRPHAFVDPVRDAASRIFGIPTVERHHTVNELDRFSILGGVSDLPHRIERYVREMTPYFAVTSGAVSYLRRA